MLNRLTSLSLLTCHVVTFLFLFPPQAVSAADIPTEREAFLEEIQKRAFLYFTTQTNGQNGLVRDWAPNRGEGEGSRYATIAGTGFMLTAYGVGVERGWMNPSRARAFVQKVLTFLLDKAPQEHGFFYHFLDFKSGGRAMKSEVSPIDTALLIAGVLFAGEYFEDPEIKKLARALYERVEWSWMLNGDKFFALGWKPESEFLHKRWTHYDESMLLYLLALGSSTHPISPESWNALIRTPGSYESHRLIQSPSLFTHQYPQIWLDLRDKHDGFADYFENSRQAVLAQRQFAIDQSKKYDSYGPNSWGLTAAQGFWGYEAFGAPPGRGSHDGTIAPTGCGASVPFAPEESIACLEHFRDANGEKLWGRYGFADAFNAGWEWYSDKVFAINQGPVLLMIENYRSELIWKVMNRLDSVQRAFEKAGFQEGTVSLPWPHLPETLALYRPDGPLIDGDFDDWADPGGEKIVLDSATREDGVVAGPRDLQGVIQFAWNQEFLYFRAEVSDDSLMLKRSGSQIFRDDSIEFFIDPQGDRFVWKNPRDFQIGFRPASDDAEAVKTWSWFQGGTEAPPLEEVQAVSALTENGYRMEGAIRWSYVGIQPDPSKPLRLTVALHDADNDHSETKFNWFFRSEGGLNRFELGRLKLQSDEIKRRPARTP